MSKLLDAVGASQQRERVKDLIATTLKRQHANLFETYQALIVIPLGDRGERQYFVKRGPPSIDVTRRDLQTLERALKSTSLDVDVALSRARVYEFTFSAFNYRKALDKFDSRSDLDGVSAQLMPRPENRQYLQSLGINLMVIQENCAVELDYLKCAEVVSPDFDAAHLEKIKIQRRALRLETTKRTRPMSPLKSGSPVVKRQLVEAVAKVEHSLNDTTPDLGEPMSDFAGVAILYGSHWTHRYNDAALRTQFEVAEHSFANRANKRTGEEYYHLDKWRDKTANSIIIAKILTKQADDWKTYGFTFEAEALKLVTEFGCAQHFSHYYDHFVTTSPMCAPRDVPHKPGNVYYVLLMEYVDGVVLSQWLMEEIALPITTPRQRAHFVAEALRGLECLHALGFAHNDVFARNVIVRNNEHDETLLEPVFIDLGLALSGRYIVDHENDTEDGERNTGALLSNPSVNRLAKLQARDLLQLAGCITPLLRQDPDYKYSPFHNPRHRIQFIDEGDGDQPSDEMINLILTLCGEAEQTDESHGPPPFTAGQLYHLMALQINTQV